MRPALIYDLISTDATLAGYGVTDVVESQSIDERPNDANYFVTIRIAEEVFTQVPVPHGPYTMIITVHKSWDQSRDYAPINRILRRVEQLLLPIENLVGTDGVRVAQVRRRGWSENQTDEGYKTIKRWATFAVSHDEFAA